MQPNHKFLRVVLGAVVGAALWAGCATERHDVAYEPAGASYDRAPEPVLDPQVNMMNSHVDTHPEWRTGWNMAFPVPPENANPAEVNIAIDQPALSSPETR